MLSPNGDFTSVIDAVFITHFHLDHVGALPYFTEVGQPQGLCYLQGFERHYLQEVSHNVKHQPGKDTVITVVTKLIGCSAISSARMTMFVFGTLTGGNQHLEHCKPMHSVLPT